jgi:hypothetical protein
MAAILPFLETEEFHFPEQLAPPGLAGLGASTALEAKDAIASSNSEMTRLLWTRSLLQNALSDKTFTLVRRANNVKIVLSSPFDRNTIPWARSSSSARNFSLFSTNSKMRCPTFDLPAGHSLVGGTCPAAGPAQTTSIGRGQTPAKASFLSAIPGVKVPGIDGKPTQAYQLKVLPGVQSLGPTGEPAVYDLARTVCSYCYATGGKYGEPSVQIGELVRYSVVSTAVRPGNGALREALIQAILWQIPQLPYDKWQVGKIRQRDASGVDEDESEEGEKVVEDAPVETPDEIRARMAKYPNVVRVHSSGDFFSKEYAAFWVEIAQRLYAEHGMKYMLWAPTRTHVLDNFADFWRTAKVPPNFVIRPSAYHLGDYAPAAQGLSQGTSVLTPEDSAESKGTKFDHQCGVYDLAKGNKTCVDALAPDGTKGCRACWVRGDDLRVNYVAH